jgi:hypothetical protein
MRERPSGPPGTKASPSRPAAGGYRFSDEFMSRGTNILLVSMFVMVGSGFLLWFLADNFSDGATRDGPAITAACLLIGGVTLPLLISGVLGGEAIRKGAGVIGFCLVMGIFASALGANEMGKDLLGPEGAAWALWGGIAAVVTAGAGFWIVGWIAKVPMWIQGPELGAPRMYLRGRGDEPARRGDRRNRQS